MEVLNRAEKRLWYLEPGATLQSRLAARATRAGVVSDARLELWPSLRSAFVAPDEVPSIMVRDATRPIETMTADALERIRGQLGE
jgi:hypothetical protein